MRPISLKTLSGALFITLCAATTAFAATTEADSLSAALSRARTPAEREQTYVRLADLCADSTALAALYWEAALTEAAGAGDDYGCREVLDTASRYLCQITGMDGMTFQPAELAKISFILTLALHLSQVRGQVNRPKNLLLLFVHIALPAAAIHVQGDDGTALVFLGIGLVMLYAGGLSHWLVAGGLTAGVVGGAALLTLRPGILKGYQFKRILAVLTPDDPALADITYQQNKGAMAIGTGGLTGQGLLSGEHIFVPNAWNDFIFAYLANVLGFLGAAAVLLLLFALCLRTLRTGLQCPDALGCNICVGIFAALFLQCVINIGMNLQVLPVIGVTLPFFSAGGSSVVMVYLCVGLVLAVSRKNRRKKLAVPIELEQV